VLCLLCATPLVCSSYSSFAPSSPFFISWWQKRLWVIYTYICSPMFSIDVVASAPKTHVLAACQKQWPPLPSVPSPLHLKPLPPHLAFSLDHRAISAKYMMHLLQCRMHIQKQRMYTQKLLRYHWSKQLLRMTQKLLHYQWSKQLLRMFGPE